MYKKKERKYIVSNVFNSLTIWERVEVLKSKIAFYYLIGVTEL